MKALHEQSLQEQTVMPKDWIRRRLKRLIQPGVLGFRPTLTVGDVARWFNVKEIWIRDLESGRVKISDNYQVQLSQFFYLFDMGFIELRVDTKSRRKTWTRNAEPKPAPCKDPRPRIDFASSKIKFD